MGSILSVEDLEAIDSSESELPSDRERDARLSDLIRRSAVRLGKLTKSEWRMENPSSYQDGALFTCVVSSSHDNASILLFSSFGNLMTTGRFREAPFAHSASELRGFVAVLETDYGFRFAHPDLLNKEYTGPMTRYPIGTWFSAISAQYSGRAASRTRERSGQPGTRATRSGSRHLRGVRMPCDDAPAMCVQLWAGSSDGSEGTRQATIMACRRSDLITALRKRMRAMRPRNGSTCHAPCGSLQQPHDPQTDRQGTTGCVHGLWDWPQWSAFRGATSSTPRRKGSSTQGMWPRTSGSTSVMNRSSDFAGRTGRSSA